MVQFKAIGALFMSAAALVFAGGSIDNSDQATLVANNAVQYSDGNYRITNVATRQQVAFVRENGVTNLELVDHGKGDPVQLQFSKQGAVRISGGNNKCASAQWDPITEGGVDHAAVSYACSVGSDTTGNASLEKTKQWWYFVPQNSINSLHQKRSYNAYNVPRPNKKRLTAGESFYIIPSDHLHDMTTRAISGSTLQTFGGYVSLLLSILDQDSKEQLWTLERA